MGDPFDDVAAGGSAATGDDRRWRAPGEGLPRWYAAGPPLSPAAAPDRHPAGEVAGCGSAC
ncbi:MULTISPECIES: hypothetical protein [unclassified Micromonospora]|uniref:hypothetical protein n=1 Tax=unclassified Micromonospora TaxID=2617518 RepID=UPI001034FD2B|nr:MULTISPECIES: hypothetical protein [unclassified Micromonospora]QKW14883.1 hypothetical protein HUT12_20300 [Verrucosispora sp. NA02020]TBL30230.1 hypothetical protein EYA84_23020 [Verrucosispora sp. SN26_14.1]